MRALAIIALLVSSAVAAGCLGSEEPAPDGNEAVGKDSNTVGGSTNATFVNPDGRGVSAAANETNKTVVGKGGIEHLHDYWEGQTEKVIFDGDIYLEDPTFCDNKDTSKIGCYVLQLPVSDPAVLVYEGAVRLTVEATAFQPWVTGLQMKVRNGANPEWGSAVALAQDTPVEIPVSAIETDMPHASASQWAWKFIGNIAPGPESLWFPGSLRLEPDFHVKITVFKGDKIVDWPGHPDFYADKPYRVVMDKDASTKSVGAHDALFFGDEANVVRPDALISSGTGKIVIYLNITEVTAQTGDVEPDSFFIDYTNATGRWYGDYTEFSTGLNRVYGNKTDPTHVVITIPVKYTGWDSPYAPTSGWQFIVRSGYTGQGTQRGLCPGCLPYEVKYHMTIHAFLDPQYAGGDALEA
ncbi:MAG TPA: hypothetical protein VNZ52_06040 [Candidatus Thermoplasmatota archaeon]|nr:hypothetical protein [Candidatus Thermoplasmatota archaeon]